jgi:HD domain
MYDREIIIGAYQLGDEKRSTSILELLQEFPIPEQFWTASASTTGKYHPSFSVGEGGLVRHTLVNMYWVRRWANFTGAKDADVSVALAAAALHDSYKGGYSAEWTTTVPDHPFIAASEIRKFAQANAANDGIRAKWFEVATAVWTHMGRFTANPADPKNKEFNPWTLDQMTEAGKLLALADYAAAQKVYDELPSILNGD